MKAFTPLHFFESRFTDQEQFAMARAVLAGDAELFLFLVKYIMAERVISTDPRLEQGRQMLIDKGLLTEERAAEIFSFDG